MFNIFKSGSKLVVYFIFFALTAVLVGKLFFAEPDYFLFFAYGITVTLAVLVTFFISFVLYKDPYELAKENGFKDKKYFVSCLVAVKDEEDVISQCVKSIINQDYKNKEIIFVNDGSIDKTGEILDGYAKKGLISVIHLKENIGKKKALARAMLSAKGEIFAFSDSDSIWEKDAISRIADIFVLIKQWEL